MNNSKYKLSICIPAYNRPGFILDCLKFLSTVSQINSVEVVVLDDGSISETAKAVEGFIVKYPKLNISFYRNSVNQGFDKTILSIVNKAKGKFCWFMSDDDLPKKQSIAKLLKIIKQNPDLSLIHMNYSRFDNRLKKITSKQMVGSISKDIVFKNADGFFFKTISNSYFGFLGTNVITMSTDVVNKKMWKDASVGIDKFIGHNFVHCFVIAKMIRENPFIYYVGKPNVQYLSNNHRIWPNDIWKDYNSVFLGYLKKIGFNKKEIERMKKAQRKYEKRETLMKHPILKYLYNVAKPVYAVIHFFKTKYQRRI